MSEPIDDGGPAFPKDGLSTASGMTLRDWFAGQALAGLMAGDFLKHVIMEAKQAGLDTVKVIPATCYAYADGLIAARKEKQ